MSKPYRVSMSHCEEEHVKSDDYTQSRISLTPILEEEEMIAILEKVIESKGWEKCEDRDVWVKCDNESRMEIDTKELTFTTFIEVEATITKEKTIEDRGDTDYEDDASRGRKAIEQRLKQQLEQELKITEKEKEDKIEELAEEAGKKLKSSEEERARIINEILVETYSDALQEKAKTMGDIVEISSSTEGGNHETIIRIKA